MADTMLATCPRCGRTVRADTMAGEVTDIPVTSLLNGNEVVFLVSADVSTQKAGGDPLKLCASCLVTLVQYGMSSYLKAMMGANK